MIGQVFGGFASSQNNLKSGTVKATDNSVRVINSEMDDLIVGGYATKSHGEADSIVTGNSVEIDNSKTKSLYGGYLGMTLSNGSGSTTQVSDNSVLVSNQSVVGSVDDPRSVMGAYVNFSEYSKNSVKSFKNQVIIQDSIVFATIYGSHVRGLFEYQKSGDVASLSELNLVQISNSKINLIDDASIIGAYAYDSGDTSHNADVSVVLNNNAVSINDVDIITSTPDHESGIYGARSDVKSTAFTSSTYLQGNSVSITNSEVSDFIQIAGALGVSSSRMWGNGSNGLSGEVVANNNLVSIRSTTLFSSRIYGGYASSWGGESGKVGYSGDVEASGNRVIIENSIISGEVYGGYVKSANYDNAMHDYVDNPDVHLIADNNKITVIGTSDLVSTHLYGSNLNNTLTNGNELVFNTWSGSVGSVNNFNKVTFENINWQNEGTVLTVLDGENSSLNGTLIYLSSINPSSRVTTGDWMYIVKSDQSLDIDESLIDVDQTFLSGVGVQGTGSVSLDESGNVIFTIEGTGASDQAKTVVTQQTLATSFINNGSDLVPEVLGYLKQDHLYGLRTFAIVQGSTSTYEVEPDLKINGWNGAFGIGTSDENKNLSLYIEIGDANYHLEQNIIDASLGKGELRYYGIGLASRYFLMPSTYMDFAARVGKFSNDMTNAFIDASNNLYGYKVDSPYYSFQVALGTDWYVGDNFSLYTRASYDYSHIGSESFHIAGNRFEVDSVSSHLLKLKVGFTSSNDWAMARFGFGYEYEFDNKSTATVDHLNISPAELKGGTWVPEMSVTANISNNWQINLTTKAYIGKREGLSTLVNGVYRF